MYIEFVKIYCLCIGKKMRRWDLSICTKADGTQGHKVRIPLPDSRPLNRSRIVDRKIYQHTYHCSYRYPLPWHPLSCLHFRRIMEIDVFPSSQTKHYLGEIGFSFSLFIFIYYFSFDGLLIYTDMRHRYF